VVRFALFTQTDVALDCSSQAGAAAFPSASGPVEMLIVESAERPVDN
jgi:hypothetical protein